jgi:DNA-binding CsgD family transcriptional regulator
MSFSRRDLLLLSLYGACLALLLFLFRWLEIRFIIVSHAVEIYAGIIAIIFTGLGIWLAVKLIEPKTKTVIVEKPVPPAPVPHEDFIADEKWLRMSGISSRELEVLELISKGLSNQEIADKLFVSANTIKSHTARLFEKLEVNRRVQAIEKGRRMGIIQ